MPLRHSLSVLAIAWASCLTAQDQDLIVKGRLTDAVTGKPLPGSADVFDEMDEEWGFATQCGLDGTYEIALYSYDSSYYVLSFQAEGHVTRRAVIDMTPMEGGLDADLAWEITMDVALKPAVDSAHDASADDLLGAALFDNKLGTIRWMTPGARAQFPVKRMQLKRLEAAENAIDSLAREEGLLVAGIVQDHWTERPIIGASVQVTAPDGFQQRLTTDEFGLYGLTLPYDRVYRLRFLKEGLVNKMVELDTRDIPANERRTGYRMQVDMRLFKELKGEDLSFLDEPIGKAAYDSVTNNMEWDMPYTRAVQERLQQVLDRHPKGR